MARHLTKKQEAFVREYLQWLNASKAARLAGYSLKSSRQIGAENLHKPNIRSLIDADLQRRSRETMEFILRRAMNIKHIFR